MAKWKFTEAESGLKMKVRGMLDFYCANLFTKNHLTDYRVVSGSQGQFMIARIKQRSEKSSEDKVKGNPPFPPVSSERLPLMDTVYPNYLVDKTRKERSEKKLRALANR
jgi:hypothetical protein